MQITVDKIIYTGKSLGKINGKVVLADEGLPGEIIEAAPIKEKRNYIAAKTERIIKPSPERIKPRCEHYKACSPYQYIDYETQIMVKERQVKEFLIKSLKMEPDNIVMRRANSIWNYRNKTHLHVVWESDRPSFAYHLPDSGGTFVKITDCFLLSEKINELLNPLINIIGENKLRFIEELSVRENSKKNQMLIVLYGSIKADLGELNKHLNKLKNNFPIAGLLYSNKKTNKEYILDGEDYMEDYAGGMVFRVGATSFFQVNTGMLEQLIRDLKESMEISKKGAIADFYSGVGLFGITLSSLASKIIAVESSGENVFFLKENAKLNNVSNLTVYEGGCEKFAPHIFKETVDALILDPPRKGAGEKLCSNILKNKPRLIFYISCNPSTLVRDLKILMPFYKLKKNFIYDFFPQTTHIETLSVLEKNS